MTQITEFQGKAHCVFTKNKFFLEKKKKTLALKVKFKIKQGVPDRTHKAYKDFQSCKFILSTIYLNNVNL